MEVCGGVTGCVVMWWCVGGFGNVTGYSGMMMCDDVVVRGGCGGMTGSMCGNVTVEVCGGMWVGAAWMHVYSCE